MNKSCYSIIIFLLFFSVMGFAENRPIFGAIEHVTILTIHREIKAKIDTGAKTSSLDARDINIQEKNGEQKVSFELYNRKTGHDLVLTFPVVRFVKIVLRKSEATKNKAFSRRPVIKLPVCIGGIKKIIEVNLVSRKRFNYPLLIGRTALIQFDALIDPSKSFLQPSDCGSLSS